MQLSLDTRFAGVQGLGPLVSQHPISRSDRFGKAFLAFVCFGAALALANLSLERHTLANNTDSPVFVNSDPLFIYWPAAACALLLVAGAWLLISLARNWNTAVALYEHGLALGDPAGLRQLRWGDVDEVLQSITNVYRNGALSNILYVYTVRTRDGQTFKLDNRFAQIKELGEALQSNATALLLPRSVRALHNGQRLAFGPLTFDHERLYHGQQMLAWAEIKAVRVHQGKMTIEQAAVGGHAWAPIPVERVPNLWVFYHIVGSLTTIA